MLALASVINGVAAYAIVVVASRSLDDAGFASFSVAWSLWAVSVALLLFPVQHWIIWRSSADRGTSGVRRALPRILSLVGLVMIALFLAGSSSRLFPVGGGWGLILAGIGASSALLGIGRGSLAAQGHYDDVAWVIGLENLLRLMAVVAVLFWGFGPRIAVIALALGALALVPFGRHFRLADDGPTPGKMRVLTELGALAGATALAQVLVQFPPALAEWLGEPPVRVSAIFATFSLGRAPLLVILAISTRVTAPVAALLMRPARVVRSIFVKAALGVAALAGAAALLGYFVGPEVVASFFGPGRALGRIETSMIATGLVMAMAGVIMILGLMAKSANRLAATYWLAAVAVAIGLALAGFSIPAAFFVAETLAISFSAGTLWNLARPHVSSSR